MKVSIEEVRAMRERRAEINDTPLDQIEWTLNGEARPMTPEEIEDWRFTGLSNIDYAVDRFIAPCVTQIFLNKQ